MSLLLCRNEQYPVVVDLDDTLLRTDSLWEGLWRMVGTSPLSLLHLPKWLSEGRLSLKRNLLPFTLDKADLYPLNEPVCDALRKASNEGRPIYIATASLRPVAEAAAARLDFPVAGIFTSDDAVNLKGTAKARVLVEAFGEKSFDYIGDSLADVPVLHAANKAMVASADARVIRAAQDANDNCEVIPVSKPGFRDFRRAFRMHQWVKNLLVFIPLFLAHQWIFTAFLDTFLAFVSLCFCASGIYILNDLCDLPNDRIHPTKRHRPFASGSLQPEKGLLYFLGAILCAVVPCFFLPPLFFLCLFLYFACTVTYSFLFKKLILLDVIILAGLYMLRIIAGGAAIGIMLSNWLLAFAAFLFLGLALMKRSGAMTMRDKDGQVKACAGRAYLVDDCSSLEMMAIASGFAALVVVSLYVDTLQATQLYRHPQWLWGVCPVLAYWYGRLVLLCHRGAMRDDPVEFAVKDGASLMSAGMLFCIFILAV